jgi:FlaA1/EpsC-like NDP-sugar epimerase
VLVFISDTLLGRLVPRSAIIAAGLITLVSPPGVRYAVRLPHDHRLRPSADRVTRVVVVGAGEGATQVVRARSGPTRDPVRVERLEQQLALQVADVRRGQVDAGFTHGPGS